MARPAANPLRPGSARAEEIASCVTHGIGLALSVAGLVVLLAVAATYGEMGRIVSAGIFGGALVLMYAASTLYHGCRASRLRHILRIVDHTAIYLLIAGTYTPVALLIGGATGRVLLAAQWGLALVGTAFKFFGVGRFNVFSTGVYLAMGWMIVLALDAMLRALPPGTFGWLLAGGLLYTGGVAFYLWERLRFNHAVWHLFVMGGSACHFWAVAFYVLPG